jgi:pimeloyl-ACP methyl ester carboxylesterase
MNTKRNFRWLRIVLRIIIIFFGSLIILCFLFDYFVQLRTSDEKFAAFFKANNIRGEVKYYTINNRRIRYLSIGNDSLPTLLFIHGSPSSSALFTDYYKDTLFLKTFKMYAVDRPGYGFSDLGNPELSIEKQAALIKPILDSFNKIHRPVIIMAQSYGTSVACRMVMDYPGLINGLVLVGPSLAPGEEKTYWITEFIKWPIFNWFVPRIFQSANAEKLSHKNQLEQMLPLWPKINIPVLYLQGAKDGLIYTSNADFAKKHLINCPDLQITFFKNRPHFIARTEKKSIQKSILKMLEIVNRKK